MSEQLQPDASPKIDEPEIMDAETFVAADFEAPIAGMTSVATYSLSSAYAKAAMEARNASDNVKASVYGFLDAVMGIHLRTTDKASPWGPQMEMTDGRRTVIPIDIKDQLEQLLPLLPNVRLPARNGLIPRSAVLSLYGGNL